MRLKSFIITASIVGVLGVVIAVFAFGMTQCLVTAADGFFGLLARGDYEGAYACLSSEFHGNTSVDELRAFAQESALAGYSGATWRERSISGDEGFLDGEVETRDGHSIPVSVFLLKEQDSWKIYQVDWFTDGPPGYSNEESPSGV